ncbi:type-2 ice-structuring protein-like protein [Lates japonicus]|uniref:Type-2 ice-structuring protein-like protein n=1 Tax=Lates japonicus TaxID=270547 RepID=A0AAD3QVQ8_LATJO|nr:type-2 ice-structuring protein-like protein [Lates japonicus]
MKLLTLAALLCAIMALTRATGLPEENDKKDNQTDESELVKRSIGMGCSTGWTNFNGRCFHFVPRHLTWAQAERNCQSMGANLASVHNAQEYNDIQWLIRNTIYEHKKTWIGGSDAQENPQLERWGVGLLRGTTFLSWPEGFQLELRWGGAEPRTEATLQKQQSWTRVTRPLKGECLHTGRLKLQADTQGEQERHHLIISTMKTLAVSALVCAMMALTRAAAFPGPKAANDQAGSSVAVSTTFRDP